MDRQAGREDLNPRLEQSRSQAAGKLSSVQPSASQLSPLSYLGDQAWCHVMVDIIALSSIYLFPLLPLWAGSNQMKWGDTRGERGVLAPSGSPIIFCLTSWSKCQPGSNPTIFSWYIWQYFSSHPHTSGSLAHVDCFFFNTDAMQEVADAACRTNMLFSLCNTAHKPLKSRFSSESSLRRTVNSRYQNTSEGSTVIPPSAASCRDFPSSR